MGHPVAHLQAQTQVHLIGHSESQTHRRRRVRLRAADQTVGELKGQGELCAPLRNLHENQENIDHSESEETCIWKNVYQN